MLILVSVRGGSKRFELAYLWIYFWVEKCSMPDLLTHISVSKNCMSSACLFYEMQFIEASW